MYAHMHINCFASQNEVVTMHEKIDHHSHIPLHAQVEQLLRNLISQPEYKAGKFLPNEVDLAIRIATNRLVHEGLIERKKGIGTKVADNRKVVTRLDHWLSFTREMREQGIEPKTFEASSSWVLPDEDLCNFFGIKKDKEILRLERLRGTSNGPIVLFISYFHPRVGLTGKEDFTLPLYTMLEKECDTIVTTSREEIKAVAADAELAKKLKVKKGHPILFRKRYVFDPGDRPVEFNLGYYNADEFTYSIEIKRG